jgi:NAD(P)-dependent dehydrogenase (short-subunit alcohol dehydrogenase family)
VPVSRFSLPDLICVITGATSGIGRATALALGAVGVNLILLGRREKEGQRLVAALRGIPGGGTAEFVRVDLSDQRQVCAVGADIAQRGHPVNVLINNAGARFNTFQQNQQGIELTFATNHLGHFLLTNSLLDALSRAPRAKVITVASSAHHGVTVVGEWHLNRENYDRKIAYGKSKLANIVFAYELARRLGDTQIVSNAVDPGGVATNLGRNNGLLSWSRHLLYYALKRELISSRRAAETLVYLALDPAVERISGKYFHMKQEIESSPASHDLRTAADLWSLSLRLTQSQEIETVLPQNKNGFSCFSSLIPREQQAS